MTPTQEARFFRRLSAEHGRMEKARVQRLRLLVEGRAAGLGWQELGEAVGMTKEGVAKLVKRHGDSV